jgi:hypothetical protein
MFHSCRSYSSQDSCEPYQFSAVNQFHSETEIDLQSHSN